MPANLMFRLLLVSLLWLMPFGLINDHAHLSASTEVVEFSDPKLRDRYYQLVEELRCPKCQNQNLADSNAPISTDMKAQIQLMLENQHSNDQIKHYLVSRYSEFILYRPEVNENTWFLWFSPLFFIILGALVVWRYAFSGRSPEQSMTTLTPEQQKQLSKLLDQQDDKL